MLGDFPLHLKDSKNAREDDNIRLAFIRSVLRRQTCGTPQLLSNRTRSEPAQTPS